MLKKFLLLTVLMFFSLNAYPHGIEQFMPVVLFKDARWTPIQISFWPAHLCSSGTGVYGLAVSPGLLSWYEKVYGISCGQIVFIGENNGLDINIYSCGFQNNGLAVGVFNEWTKNNGVSLGLVNFIRNRNGNIEERTDRNTLQIGVFNQANSGLQIGLLNYNPNAMIPWMPLINYAIPRSVESSLNTLRETTYLLDHHIEKHADKYFPNWNTEERLHWLNELFPRTDAGATTALMEVAEKYALLRKWDEYALTLPEEQRKRLRYSLGIMITQKYWLQDLETTPDGTCTLTLTNMPDNARCSFTASFKDLPANTPLRVTWYNSDLGIGYPVEKTIQNGNTITHISNFVTLFTVRHDAETNLWYETGSWEEVRQKTPAVTTYREILHGPVCTRIIDGKKIYKNFRLKDQCRKIKLGRLESNDILQTPAEQ